LVSFVVVDFLLVHVILHFSSLLLREFGGVLQVLVQLGLCDIQSFDSTTLFEGPESHADPVNHEAVKDTVHDDSSLLDCLSCFLVTFVTHQFLNNPIEYGRAQEEYVEDDVALVKSVVNRHAPENKPHVQEKPDLPHIQQVENGEHDMAKQANTKQLSHPLSLRGPSFLDLFRVQ
jgi:hypothetical protein